MKYPLVYIFLIAAFVYGLSPVYAQEESPSAATERVILFTDRIMYISGENILFTAGAGNISKPGDPVLSKVLYCELITPDGRKVAGGKYPLENSKSNGCLEIPADIVSGFYYLKAYTRLMRNEGPVAYHFTKLIIINPVKPDVLPSHNHDTIHHRTGYELEPEPAFPLILTTDKKTYSRREKVTINLADHFKTDDSCMLLCLSVVPEMTVALQEQPEITLHPETVEAYYYPETRGISLTGTLQEKDSGLPLPGKKVNLSIIGDKDFMAMRTDSSGRFFFNLNGYRDNRDLFICSEKIPGSDPVVLVDNDFCTRHFDLPSPSLRLTEPEKKTALQLALNYQVMESFRKDSIEVAQVNHNGKPSFYGKPSRILLLDKYIELPTLEEYFNELPNEVRVRKSDNKKYFRFFSTQTEMVIYDPLVLIDWVAVDDIDLVLSLSPRDISRIEMFNAPYFKGQMLYGGIISFISRNNDFAGVDLPSSGTFINYGFFQTCDGKAGESVPEENLPDGRNTIYWNPDVPVNGNGHTTVGFTTPDTPGTYLILLRGVDHDGTIFSFTERIEIL